MRTPQTALLLIGSPKPGASSSESLGAYLFEDLERRGVKTQTLRVVKAVRTEEATEELLAAVASADLIVFSFPLYVDSVPAPAIRALELIAARRAGESGGPAFVAICQSGFPEVGHNEVAVEICRNFANSAGFEWAGGLVMPEGGMLNGEPMSKMKGRMRSAAGALDLTAEVLAAGRPVPDEAVKLMAKPALPAFGYRFMANLGWRSQVKKHGEGASLDAQPHA
jgi:hypothetical protein